MPTMPTFLPGPAPLWISGENMVNPAQSIDAASSDLIEFGRSYSGERSPLTSLRIESHRSWTSSVVVSLAPSVVEVLSGTLIEHVVNDLIDESQRLLSSDKSIVVEVSNETSPNGSRS